LKTVGGHWIIPGVKTVWLIATAILASALTAGAAEKATEKKELEEDTCAALMSATCGRAPYGICEPEDRINDGELRARWARTDVLCRRYKDRYGHWLEGCCDYLKKAEDRAAAKERCYAAFRKHQQPSDCSVYHEMWSSGLSSALGAIDGYWNRLNDLQLDPEARKAVLADLKRQCELFVKTFNEPTPLACN
jgi:hypothetical protein